MRQALERLGIGRLPVVPFGYRGAIRPSPWAAFQVPPQVGVRPGTRPAPQTAYGHACQIRATPRTELLLKIIDDIFERIGITVRRVRELTGTSYTAASNNMKKLIEYGILLEYKFSGMLWFPLLWNCREPDRFSIASFGPASDLFQIPIWFQGFVHRALRNRHDDIASQLSYYPLRAREGEDRTAPIVRCAQSAQSAQSAWLSARRTDAQSAHTL